MKLAVFLGMPMSIIGLILYFPPVQVALINLFGYPARLLGAIVFASGWSLLLGYLGFNFGFRTQQKVQQEDDFE